ncbi:MAG: cell division protein FtsA [Candidatus Yonathbacteria bacterium RIFOXYD1_FULL_52_36]|uniref:Cell division protein FtsA n=1 Tax=Candidatus Yonathbacteria bacterium RIFOXYD1_FULL_52_36 TaxID=1802730 RepID=A0A1G2SM15_9BACT|nr:MAG: cell division protein FtsA [Candidatus Yonathbacteria bacterium RIFOXYD1_FULL_52_36]
MHRARIIDFHLMATRSIITGIDIGTHATRVVVCEQAATPDALPRIIGTGVAESKGLRHGYVVDPHEAARSIRAAIAAAEKAAGVPIKSALLSIGGISLESMISHGTVMVSRADGEVTQLDVEKAVTESENALAGTQNKEILDTIPLRYRLDSKEILGRPQGFKGSKLEVKTFFITSLKQHLADLTSTVEEAGVDVIEIVPAPIAAARIALTKHQRVAGCVLANIGAETVSIAVFENDAPISLQVFPIGSINITYDISLGLRIPIQDAEKLKMGDYSGTFSRKKLDEIVEARVSEIFELVEAHLKKIGKNGLLPAGIILTGGGAGIATIEDLARGILKLPSSIALPELPGNQKATIRDSSWFVAYGLCVHGSQNNSRPSLSNGGNISDMIDRIKTWFNQYLP